MAEKQRWKTDLREEHGTHLELSMAMTYSLCVGDSEEFEFAMLSIFQQMSEHVRKKRRELRAAAEAEQGSAHHRLKY
jgi:hypothetical protein